MKFLSAFSISSAKRKNNDHSFCSRLEVSYASRLVVRGDVSSSVERMAESVRLARASGDEEVRWVASAYQAYPWLVQGRLDAAGKQLREVIEATRSRLEIGIEFHGASIHVFGLMILAQVEFSAGRISEARRLTDRLLAPRARARRP